MTDFDPYYHWLGIPADEQPASLFRLLGLYEGETNPEVIENAADRAMAYLRQHAAGRHATEAARLLNEVARARLILLDPEKRAQYQQQRLHRKPPIIIRPPRPIRYATHVQPDGIGLGTPCHGS